MQYAPAVLNKCSVRDWSFTYELTCWEVGWIEWTETKIHCSVHNVLFPSKLWSLTLSTVYQALCQSFALFYVSADREKDGWRARLQAKVRYVGSVFVSVCWWWYSILLSMLLGFLFPAYHAFCCQDWGFDRNARANYACTFYKEKKTRSLFISSQCFCPVHTHSHTLTVSVCVGMFC